MDAFWGLLGVAIGSVVTIVLQRMSLAHEDRARNEEAARAEKARNEEAARLEQARREEATRVELERRDARMREASARLLAAFNLEEIRRQHTFVDKEYAGDRAAAMHQAVDVFGPIRLELQKARLEPFSEEVLTVMKRFDSSLDDVLGTPDAVVGMPMLWVRVQERLDELLTALRSELEQNRGA